MTDDEVSELIEESTLKIEMFYNVDIPREKRLPGNLSAKAVIKEALEMYYRKIGVLSR